MKIAVIANCHVQPIVQALAAQHEVTEVLAVPIHLYGSAHFAKVDEKFKPFIDDKDAIVLSFVTAERFGFYATSHLKAQVANFYTLTNVYFSGLHPDITYLDDEKGRIAGCLGDYHSKIILHSFLTGLSPANCLARFTADHYEKWGFLAEFEQSAATLRERDSTLDIAFAASFLQLLPEQPCLYTLNHPTATVFQELAVHIGQHLGFNVWRQPPALLNNPLANNTWWPVYDAIAEAHKLAYRMPCLFKQPPNLGGKWLSLAQFIAESYQRYHALPDRLRACRQTRAIVNRLSC